MNKIIGPTYYVRHPDDSYSVANPQPSPINAWEDANTVLPPLDVPVWLHEDGDIYFGMRTEPDEDGWVWTRIYANPEFSEGKWATWDSEYDDDYKPSHWQYLPQPPKEDGDE